MASAPPPPMPSRVGRYELLAPIASGGMASVYLARARGVGGFEREVALKLTHAHLRENPDFGLVLLEEAKLAGRIRHTHVVSVLDVGEDPLGLYLVMDYVEGDTLHGLQRKHLAERRVPLPRGVGMRILLDALAGLQAAHELRGDDGESLGVVHRDFTPQNVLVGTDGVAKLADFGIAKATSRGGHTATGVIKGKARYMSPEQARGRPVDRRCDVWAAGVVAWELLAGRKMHDKVDDVPMLLRIVTEPPTKLRAAGVAVSTELEAAVASALEMDPERRCPTAVELARRLREAYERTDRLEEPSRVGTLVADLAGAGVAARRKQAQVALDRTVPSPHAPTEEVTHTSDRVAMTATIAETAGAKTVAVDPVGIAPAPRVPVFDEGPAPPRARRSASRWMWAGGAAAALAAIVTTALLRTGASQDATTAGAASAAIASTAQPAAADSTVAPAPPASTDPVATEAMAQPPAPPPSATAPTAPATTHAGPSPRRSHPATGAPAAPKSTTTPPPGKLAPAPW
jgi:eukaryotic-like serine/threonine-protein kinase